MVLSQLVKQAHLIFGENEKSIVANHFKILHTIQILQIWMGITPQNFHKNHRKKVEIPFQN